MRTVFADSFRSLSAIIRFCKTCNILTKPSQNKQINRHIAISYRKNMH